MDTSGEMLYCLPERVGEVLMKDMDSQDHGRRKPRATGSTDHGNLECWSPAIPTLLGLLPHVIYSLDEETVK